jgi:hypothetical protein
LVNSTTPLGSIQLILLTTGFSEVDSFLREEGVDEQAEVIEKPGEAINKDQPMSVSDPCCKKQYDCQRS